MNIYRGKHVDKRIFIEQYPDIIQISDKECFKITHTLLVYGLQRYWP